MTQRPIKLNGKERKILYEIIEIIESEMGGYNQARPIIEKLEKRYGLVENPNFSLYKERFLK